MGLSVNKFTYAGIDTFDLNFALGYNSASDITCVGPGEVEIDFDWLTSSRVRITGHDLQAGDELSFFRTVSKTSLPVDIKQPSELTRENLEAIIKHSAYISHEVLDGRVDDTLAVEQAIIDAVNSSVTNAIEATNLLISQRYPVTFTGDLTGPRSTVVPANVNTSLSEVTLVVTTPPATAVEMLFTNNGVVKFWAVVQNDGTFVLNSNSPDGLFTLSKGDLTVTETTGDYVSGMVYSVGVNGVDTDYLSYTTEYPDYVETYTNARDNQ